MDVNDANLSSIIEYHRPTTRNKTRSFYFTKSLSRNSSHGRRSKSRQKPTSRGASHNEIWMSDESDNNAYEASKDFQREKKNDNILRTTLKDSSFTKNDKKKFIEATKQFSNFLKNGTKELSKSKKESYDYNKSLPINFNEQQNEPDLNTTEVRNKNRLIKAMYRRQLNIEEKEIIKSKDINARRIARGILNESEKHIIKERDLSNLRRKRECMNEKKH